MFRGSNFAISSGNNMTEVNGIPNGGDTGNQAIYNINWNNYTGWFYVQPTASQFTNNTGLMAFVSVS